MRLYGEASRHADDLAARNEQLQHTRDALTVARQREVLDSERHRIARELHDSVTQYALSAGMQIEVVRSEIRDERQRERLETAKALTRRAVEQLRSAIYALHHHGDRGRQSLPAMLEELSTVHMPTDLRVEVRIEGRPGRCCPRPPSARSFRVAGEALFNAAVHAEAARRRRAPRPSARTAWCCRCPTTAPATPSTCAARCASPRPATSTARTAAWSTWPARPRDRRHAAHPALPGRIRIEVGVPWPRRPGRRAGRAR